MQESAPSTPDPYPNRIQDVNKAHVMALAGHERRTKAASARKTHAHINKDRKSIWDDRDNSYMHVAEREDRKAERLEEWAGVLYDHPVNQAYKDWHLNPLAKPEEGRLDFTPNDMVELEDGAMYLRNNLTRGIGDDPGRFDIEKKTYAMRSTRWNILKKVVELDKVNPGLEAQVDEMIREDSTTIGDLVNFYKKSWQAIADSRRRTAREIEIILDDIKTGRASEWIPPVD